MGFQDASRRIEQLREESVDFLSRVCSIPAIGPANGGSGEMEKYVAIRDVVRQLQPDEEIEVPAPDDRVPEGVRPNLLAIFHGKDKSLTLWILSHIDVVPPGESKLWDHDPFKPFVEDGYLYGRGVEDNGQALAASIFATRAVKETCGLDLNVGLALVSDEETGSLYGLDYVLQQRLDIFRPDDLILVPDSGNKDGDHIEIAEKHLFQVLFRLKGIQGHASRPELSRNTLRSTAHLIVEMDKRLPQAFPHADSFFEPAVSTFEPTKKDANVPNINTIPGEDVFYMDCRVLPEVKLSSVIDEMRRISKEVGDRFGVRVSVEEHLKIEAPDPTPSDAPVVIALAQAVQEVYGVQPRPVGIGGQTVAAFFRKRGRHAAVWEKILHCAHAPNERIAIDNLIGNTKVFARMMLS